MTIKRGVGLEAAADPECPNPFRVTLPQFCFQVFPLEAQLPARDGEGEGPSLKGDLGGVEGIPPVGRLVVDGPQVRRDGTQRVGGLPEPVQLRVGTVASRVPPQHLLSEQGLPPKRHQPLGVQQRRM
jgi:hypothetical protein